MSHKQSASQRQRLGENWMRETSNNKLPYPFGGRELAFKRLPGYPSTFGGRETAFEQLLDRLVKRFEIADREGLKTGIEVIAIIYDGGRPKRLSRDDLDQLRDLAPKMAGALQRNASAIEHTIMKFEAQHVFGLHGVIRSR